MKLSSRKIARTFLWLNESGFFLLLVVCIWHWGMDGTIPPNLIFLPVCVSGVRCPLYLPWPLLYNISKYLPHKINAEIEKPIGNFLPTLPFGGACLYPHPQGVSVPAVFLSPAGPPSNRLFLGWRCRFTSIATDCKRLVFTNCTEIIVLRLMHRCRKITVLGFLVFLESLGERLFYADCGVVLMCWLISLLFRYMCNNVEITNILRIFKSKGVLDITLKKASDERIFLLIFCLPVP